MPGLIAVVDAGPATGRHLMSTVTITFLAIGCLSLLLLLLSLIGGGHLDAGHLHAGGPDGGGALSLPALSGFIGAFGFGGAIAAELAPAHSLLAASAVGVLAGIPTAWAAGRLARAARNMRTDATLTSGDLVGATGTVITPIPAGGLGEVRLAVAGQPLKFNARSAVPLATGTHIFVIEVPSPTSVLVEPTPHVF
jgi:membrane protein implicated in regulation of membrane protease activity